MKLSEIIKEAQKKLDRHGDIVCLIEVSDEYGMTYYMPVEELAFEKRQGYEESICFLM